MMRYHCPRLPVATFLNAVCLCGAVLSSVHRADAQDAVDTGVATVADERLLHDVQDKIVYSKVGDRELLLDAYVPEPDRTYPAVLVIHGGAWRMGDRKQLRQYAAELASRGFCCFAIDYRLAPEHKFPAQIDDCRAAVRWIRQNAAKYKVDATRLGAIGYSAGGHLATLLGTTGEAANETNQNIDMRLQAVAAGGAPTDFRWFPDKGRWAKYWMGGTLDTVPEKFQAASAAAFIDAKDPPTFFFNGTKDELVPLIWTQTCHLAMKDAGIRTELYTIDGANHMQAAADKDALAKACEFLTEELKLSDSLNVKAKIDTKPIADAAK